MPSSKFCRFSDLPLSAAVLLGPSPSAVAPAGLSSPRCCTYSAPGLSHRSCATMALIARCVVKCKGNFNAKCTDTLVLLHAGVRCHLVHLPSPTRFPSDGKPGPHMTTHRPVVVSILAPVESAVVDRVVGRPQAGPCGYGISATSQNHVTQRDARRAGCDCWFQPHGLLCGDKEQN